MRHSVLRVFLLLVWLGSAPAWAATEPFFPALVSNGDEVTRSNVFHEFAYQLKGAIERRDLAAIQALYQTNGILAEELRLEMKRWSSLLPENANGTVSLFGRDLSAVPPRALQIHTEEARRLTDRKVTHLILVHVPAGHQLTLPLVLVGDKMLIVPSEKKNKQ